MKIVHENIAADFDHSVENRARAVGGSGGRMVLPDRPRWPWSGSDVPIDAMALLTSASDSSFSSSFPANRPSIAVMVQPRVRAISYLRGRGHKQGMTTHSHASCVPTNIVKAQRTTLQQGGTHGRSDANVEVVEPDRRLVGLRDDAPLAPPTLDDPAPAPAPAPAAPASTAASPLTSGGTISSAFTGAPLPASFWWASYSAFATRHPMTMHTMATPLNPMTTRKPHANDVHCSHHDKDQTVSTGTHAT